MDIDVLQAHLGEQHTLPQELKETQNPSVSPGKIKSLPTNRKSEVNQFHVCQTDLFFHHTTDDVIFQNLICMHAAKLLCKDDPHSHFTNVPTKDKVWSFNKTKGPCCTVSAFCLDFTDVLSSAWNNSASHVFTDSFREAHLGCQQSSKDIFTAFTVHFRYLRRVYEQHQDVAWVAQEQIVQAAVTRDVLLVDRAKPGRLKRGTHEETLRPWDNLRYKVKGSEVQRS